ncbi:MAG: carbamoyltransferase HypF [Candidatus Omnitrophota bacterium]
MEPKTLSAVPAPAGLRLQIVIRGIVQGVGFRPFIFRLATSLGLSGWVRNDSGGILIEAEGNREALEQFLLRIEKEKPPRAYLQSLESSFLDPVGYPAFEIKKSDSFREKTALILPDIATCPDCLKEIFDPLDRRYRYPFTNCTQCGPRYSILEALPYDRANTTMKTFILCERCREEYEDPRSRRFHAQPNACPECGPRLALWDRQGKMLEIRHEALLEASRFLREGLILAVKGLGGFHLVVDARRGEAVFRLRQLKGREEKPFALMAPSLEWVKRHCELSALEERLLLSPESPIVLLRRKSAPAEVADAVAPGNPYWGVMLPYTPLHHLLMAELGFPVVATSGNLSEETICTEENEVLTRLGPIADAFLVHNRPIARHVDDSVARVMASRELILRRARGYAPLPVRHKTAMPPLLAVGAHLKNTVAVSVGNNILMSQHIGDLETVQALGAFQKAIAAFKKLYGLCPEAVACDAHPNYISTQYAKALGLPVVFVQHHHAHALSCMAENELEGPLLGVCWDGTGYGLDGTVWGGEFLQVSGSTFLRRGHLRTFRLPGRDQAIREPRRAAIGLLYELFGSDCFAMDSCIPVRSFTPGERRVLERMLQKGVNAPYTSSAGRLFDAVSALIGVCQRIRYETQAAMELEFALEGFETEAYYEIVLKAVREKGKAVTYMADWGPMVLGILKDAEAGLPLGEIAAKFHNALAELIVSMAHAVGERRVVLSGGCFQNRFLTERAVSRLREERFFPYWHQRIPPNDGGIAVGQVIAALAQVRPKAEDASPVESTLCV